MNFSALFRACYRFQAFCLMMFPVLGGVGFDDFSTYPAGTGLGDLPYEVLSGSFAGVEVVEDAEALSGQVLRLRHSSNRASLARTGVAFADQGEILALVRPNSGGQQRYTPPGIMLAAGENGYRYRYLDFSSGGWGTRLDYYVNGSLDDIGSRTDWQDGPEGEAPVWIRHRILAGGQHAVRIWPKNHPEPEAWRLTAENTAHTEGGAGFFLTDSGQDFEVEYFAWSDRPDTQPAPGPWDEHSGNDEPPSGTITFGAPVVSDTEATVPFTYSGADQDAFEYRLDGGGWQVVAAPPLHLQTLSPETTYLVEVRAWNTAGGGDVFGVSFTTEAQPDPEGIFEHQNLVNSFGDGSLTNAGYSFQDRQPLASFEAPDGTLWQVAGYISLDRLPVVQWRYREPGTAVWSLWARIGQDAAVLPAPGSNWHGYVSVGIDTAGHVHLIYDGRSSNFRYYRSDTPIHQDWTGGLVNRSANGIPGWSASTDSTYWRFSKHPETGMMTLAMRRSGSGHSLFVLDAETQVWSAFPGTRQSDGRLFTNDGLFAHYVAHDVVFRGDDVFVGYSERQAGSATTNEDLSVVKYCAAAGEWMRLDGTVLQTPIGRGQGTVIDPSKTGSMLDHRWDMMADGQGRVHGFYRRLDDQDRLQIFHFWIDEENHVHGPQAVTHFPDYTDFWQNTTASGVNLSQARSFYLGGTVYLAWQEQNHGQRVRARAARYPFTDWSDAVEIDDINLRTSDPEFERWAWDSRGEIWLTAMPFAPNTSGGLPVTVRQIPAETLPLPPAVPFANWIAGTGVPEDRRDPTDRNGPLQLQNLESYALGVDPMHATAEDLMRITRPAGEQPRIHFFRNLLAENLLIEFEASSDLQAWAPIAPASLQTPGRQGDREMVEVVFPQDSSGRLFLRMIYRVMDE